MDEDISIINSNTRNEKIKNFFINNKKKLFSIVLIVILSLISFFGYKEFNERNHISISNQYNSAVIEFSEDKKINAVNKFIDIINKKDPTYSTLSLYFLIDNKLIADNKKINELFDIILEETPLDDEIKKLVILKKALFNADQFDEGSMLTILNPVINSESVWKAHALHLMAEFFYFKNEKQKAKEFYNQIVNLEKANPDIKIQAQKRLNRDFSE
ncbi:MAG: hypothetical protein CNC05_04530 [Pelagibacterales bacterium MED-G42]|nr:MAG: hypothetical protein CNC05_04530 [Pelagibacterales bacterium MED-G42]